MKGRNGSLPTIWKLEVAAHDIKSTLLPSEAILWTNRNFSRKLCPTNFATPTHRKSRFILSRQTTLSNPVDAPAGWITSPRQVCRSMRSGRLLFTDIGSAMRIKGSLGVVVPERRIFRYQRRSRYQALSRWDGSIPSLADLYFSLKQRACFTCDRWTGLGSDARNRQVPGHCERDYGDIFAIPIFGPLSGMLSAIVPGAGYSLAHKANASFTVEEGVIHTDDFKVSGKLFGMVGHGDIRFLDDKLDLDIRIDAGGPGVLLTPMYKLFEYKGEGSISKPTWRPNSIGRRKPTRRPHFAARTQKLKS